MYAGVGALMGTVIASMAGYALAKYVFVGRSVLFSLVLGAILVPVMALTFCRGSMRQHRFRMSC